MPQSPLVSPDLDLAQLLVPGSVIDRRYRVERVLGRGGMGVVLSATDLSNQAQVAVKVLCPRHASSRAGLPRFKREARVAYELGGAGVPRVFGGGRDPRGLYYLAMERLVGEDLAELLSRNPQGISVGQACELVSQVCRALVRIHAAGIVHRDLKPSNLFVTRQPDGTLQVKILDFGISKLQGSSSPGNSLTQASDIMGSPSYMSPEQVQTPRSVDLRTDIWSLGCVLYELLTGRLAFSADSAPALFVAVMMATPRPPSAIRGDLPRQLDTIIERCLDKNPQCRFQTTQELGSALVPFCERVGLACAPDGRYALVSVTDAESVSTAKVPPVPTQEQNLLLALEERFSSPQYRPPRLPATAVRLVELAQKTDVNLREMVALMQEDPFLSAEVVRLAESSAFGGNRVRTLEDALTRLGIRRATDAFLTAATHLRVFRTPGYQEPMDRLRLHSVLVAHLARQVSRQTPLFDEHAFLCGLLHDIGLAAGLIVLGDVERGTPPPSFEVAWPAVLHVHEHSGGRVVRLWELPDEIALAIEHHHHPRIEGRLHPTAGVICVADWIAEVVGGGIDTTDAVIAQDAVNGLGISPQQLERLFRTAENLVKAD